MGHWHRLSVGAIVACAAAAAFARPYTVTDSPALSVFEAGPLDGARGALASSPDGRLQLVVTQRGLVADNRLEATLWLFSTAALERYVRGDAGDAPLPRRLARWSARVNNYLIGTPRWSADGRHIYVLVRGDDDARRLFQVTVSDGRVRQLSLHGQDVNAFDVANGVVLYSARPALSNEEQYKVAGAEIPDMEAGTGQSLLKLLFPRWESHAFGLEPQMLWVRDAKGLRRVPAEVVNSQVLSLSPSGRWAVITRYADRIPSSWAAYAPADGFEPLRADPPTQAPTRGLMRPQRYAKVDLSSGAVSDLLGDAPLAGPGYLDSAAVAWSIDEKHLAVSRAYLPFLGSADAEESLPCIAVVSVASGQARCVKRTPAPRLAERAQARVLRSLRWDDGRLVLNYAQRNGQSPDTETFAVEASEPKLVPRRAVSRPDGIQVAVHQDLNSPPALIASDANGQHERIVWNPNDQLSKVESVAAREFGWNDEQGRPWKGGLLVPPGCGEGRTCPLVIQTHGFDARRYMSDGFSTTGYAARVLAARGIVVLQVQERMDGFGTPAEADTAVAGYMAAIDRLANDGIADASKVGITAFSRTGWYVLEALERHPQRFAAAVLAESSSLSLSEYLLNADYLGVERSRQLARAIGGEPFGPGLATWLRTSPGFGTDAIAAPVLMQANSPPALAYVWDVYAALRLQGKPVDLLYLRSGDHVLGQPAHRVWTQQMVVDWYDYWLNGHVDPDRERQVHYVRWQSMRR